MAEEAPQPAPNEDTPVELKPVDEAQARPLTEQDKKALQFIDQAEKKVKSASSFIGGLFGGTTKLEDAADLYVRAANAFKVAKNFEGAGHSFSEAAKLYLEKLDSRHEAATNFAEAAQVYKKVNAHEAVMCFQQAIEIYTDMGRFNLAARYYSSTAEIFEIELVDLEKAVQSYEQAADFYKTEDSTASANKCLGKVAHMCAQLEQFEKAATIFEEIAKGCLDVGLLKYSAKDYFFKALVCIFCQDYHRVEEKAEEYKAIHPAFDSTREYKLIEHLLQAFDERDGDKFAEVIQDYDSISRIDGWLTAQLLYIKKKIDAPDDVN